MNNVFLTVDVECHDYIQVNQYIWGKCKDGESGLRQILELGKKYEIPINFFVDIPECKRYGDQYIHEIIDVIKEYGQPILLHLHPNYVTGDDARTFMWEYSEADQRQILQEGVYLYKKFFGSNPTAYRAGRYGVEDKTYDLIRETIPGVIDFSYGAGNGKMTKLTAEEFGATNVGRIYRGVKCMPNNTYVAFDAFGVRKRVGVDAAQLRIPEFKGFLKVACGRDFVLTMHSWHFIDKVFWNKNSVRLNRKYVRKFEKFVKILKEKGYVFANIEDTNFDEIFIEHETEDFDYNPTKGLNGFLFSLVMNFLRFQEIAKLNKKYFRLYACFYSALILAAVAVFILIILL